MNRYMWESWVAFLVVSMANDIAHGHVRQPLTIINSILIIIIIIIIIIISINTCILVPNMAAILLLLKLVDSIHLWYIGHQRYGELTPVKTRYPLTSITWLYPGLEGRVRGRQLLFKVDRWPGTGFDWITGSSQVSLSENDAYLSCVFCGLMQLHGHASWTKARHSRRLSCLGGKRFGKHFSCTFRWV